ncbi:hypothetical protein FKR81_14740 [Lentzea tibetensis]|uniref:Uncharacterized protein n=1 Tax=Lentzea tibetensis TaxID=2591470 RepID=A0A563EUS5_9PSEU|nr:hypothetical protein [Lentzea tibetensis]TWP51467.1 hypothetical protein FKR81_14740 [Lentzea tibetensis]
MTPRTILTFALVLELTAVTISDHPASGVATLLLTLLAAGYAWSCWAFPFRPCPSCKGSGRHVSSGLFRGVQLCKRCKATGLKLRRGRAIYNALHRHRTRTRRNR